MRASWAVLLVVLLTGACAALPAAADPPVPPAPGAGPNAAEEGYGEEITVALSTLAVRVLDNLGHPVTGLGPQDFRVRIGRSEVPVAAVDWFSSEVERAAPGLLPLPPADAAPATPPSPGQLLVFFVQADLNPTRISGQLRLRPYTRDLLDHLHPNDQIAVVSYDSHLKLRQDFTRDRDAVYAALDRAMLWTDDEEPAAVQRLSDQTAASLVTGFNRAAARRAASPERALEVTARALARLPGEKSIVYLGWGLGRYGAGGVQMIPAFAPAVRALTAAHASVFVLDVTSADFHSLEVGLQRVAAATGGAYAKTNILPGLATEALGQILSGYYLLTLDHGAIEGLQGDVRIDLRTGRGTVFARPLTVH